MKKFKILILSDYAFVKGGAERVAISSSIGLAQRKHQVIFFSAVGPVCSELVEGNLHKIICLDQKDILDNPDKISAIIDGIYNRQVLKALKKELEIWKPDIVHAHGMSKALSWAPVNLLNKMCIPIVYTLHDYGLICPNMGIYDFKKDNVCDYYKPGKAARCFVTNCDKRNYFQKLWRWSRFFINRHIFRIDKKITCFIAVSNFMKERISEAVIIKVPVYVVYNPIERPGLNSGTDKKEFDSKFDSKNNLPVQFIYVGRLSPEKGVDILADVMESVEGKLVIIGDGELIDYCRGKARLAGENKIRILGYQDKEVIRAEMSASHALVLPSRCMEPAPLVVGEAAFNSLPSIVADHGSLREFVSDGTSGLYFKANCHASLIKAMNRFVLNPELRIALGRKAAEMVEKMGMDIGNHTDNIEEIYRGILNNKM